MQNVLKQSRFLPHSLALTAALSLTACGGTGQDAGQSKAFSQTFQGVAVDGYVARSLVFIDYDNNGTRDPWEPSAFTDDDGYYSYNPRTDTNYCAQNTPAAQAIYCLRSKRQLDNAVIRVDGGYDVMTGEPFLGQMSRRQTVSSPQETVTSVISPLTSLFTDTSDENAKNKLLQTLAITEEDLDVDYLNTDGMNSIETRLLNKALKVHKAVSVLSDRVTDTYTEIGKVVGTPNDVSSLVYKNLAKTIESEQGSLNEILQNATALTRVISMTETDTRAVYTNRDILLPASVTNNTSSARVSTHVVNLVSIIDRVVNGDDGSVDAANLVGRARAVESYVIKAVNEASQADVRLDNAASFFLNDNNADLVDGLIASLNEDTADLSQLVANDFTGDDFDEVSEVVSATQLPEGTQAFRWLGGSQLKVSDLDLGWGPNNLKDSEVEVYFLGDTSATSGEYVACVKYIDGASSDGTLGEANTRGELVKGFWSLLGAEKSGGSSFSLLMTIDFLGTTYQAIIKPAGSETIDGYDYFKFRFDYGDEIRTWHSEDMVSPIESIPVDNKDCRQRLPSRINL